MDTAINDLLKEINMDFSFIIPVYNVEKYLKKCLESILKCKLIKYEMILVIGKSDDLSNEICFEYEKKYDNIKVVEQNSKGLSNARNCGMKVAVGKYFVFIDSDDFVHSENFEDSLYKIKNLNKDIDVLISDYYWVNDDDEIVRNINQIEETENIILDYDYFKNFFNHRKSFWNVWRYVYRKDFLLNENFFFKEGFMAEDVEYTTKILIKAKNVAFYHKPFYCYRIRRQGSLMNDVSYKRIHDGVVLFDDSVKKIKESNFKYKKEFIKKVAFSYILDMATIYEVPKNEKIKVKKLFKDTKKILDNNFFFIGKIIYLSSKIGLFWFFAYMLHIMKLLKRKKEKSKGY